MQLDTFFTPPSEIEGFNITAPAHSDSCLGLWFGTSKSTGESVVIKILSKDSMNETGSFQQLASQMELMNNLKHPLLARVHNVVEDKKFFYYVTDAPRDMLLNQRVEEHGRFDEDRAKRFLSELMSFLNFIKTETARTAVVVTSESIITDENLRIMQIYPSFNNQVKISNNLMSACFTPPEAITDKGTFNKQSYIWVCGVFLYYITVGALPFKGSEVSAIHRKILNKRPVIPLNLSEDLQDLLNRMLVKNPIMRIDNDAIMSHKWMKEIELPTEDFVRRRKSVEFKQTRSEKEKPPYVLRRKTSQESETTDSSEQNSPQHEHQFNKSKQQVRLTPKKQLIGIKSKSSSFLSHKINKPLV